MNKLVVALSGLFVMFQSYSEIGQEKVNMNGYRTSKTHSVSKNQLLKKYPELDSNGDYKNVEKLVLKNGIELLKQDNSKVVFTYDYALYDKATKDLLFFPTKIVKNKSIEVFDSKGELLYTILNENGKEIFNLNHQLRAANCFRDCMEESEEAVVDGLIGWMAWNLSPGVQLAAAIRCEWNCQNK